MSELTNEEIRNNILVEIHNRLAEISTYLKTGLAILANSTIMIQRQSDSNLVQSCSIQVS